MLLLETILKIYFKLAGFFFVRGGVGNVNLKLSLVAMTTTSIAFTLDRQLFSSCLGKCCLQCSHNRLFSW